MAALLSQEIFPLRDRRRFEAGAPEFVCGLRDWKHARAAPSNATKASSSRKKRSLRRLPALLCFVVALACAGNAAHLQAKAVFAQLLLQRAFAQQARTGEATKPWPWADTVPVAKLSLPAHGQEQIVLEGDSGRTLAFGPGWAPASAMPGTTGTVVISGHRDTHFSFLRNVAEGDEVRLVTPDGRVADYRIAERFVADARSERIALRAEADELWLVTCWPFDAVAPGGPMRFVARAVRSPS